jgi:hypothetical protein
MILASLLVARHGRRADPRPQGARQGATIGRGRPDALGSRAPGGSASQGSRIPQRGRLQARVRVGVDRAVRPHDTGDVAELVPAVEHVVVEVLVLDAVLVLVDVDPVVVQRASLGYLVEAAADGRRRKGQAGAPSVRSGSSGLSSGLDARYGLCGPQN